MITFAGVELKDVEAGFDDKMLNLNTTVSPLNTGGTRVDGPDGDGAPGRKWRFSCRGTAADIAALEAVSDYRLGNLVVNGVTTANCMITRWTHKNTTDPKRIIWYYGVEIVEDTSGRT